MKPILLLNVMLAGLCFTSSAQAETTVRSINPSYPGEQYEVTEEKLQQFHNVQQKVQKVEEQYRREAMQAGPNQAAAAAAVQRANAAKAKVIDESGMSMQEYNQLSKAIADNNSINAQYQRLRK